MSSNSQISEKVTSLASLDAIIVILRVIFLVLTPEHLIHDYLEFYFGVDTGTLDSRLTGAGH